MLPTLNIICNLQNVPSRVENVFFFFPWTKQCCNVPQEGEFNSQYFVVVVTVDIVILAVFLFS